MPNPLRLYAADASSVGGDEDIREVSGEAGWADLKVGARIVFTPDGRPIRRLAPRSRRPIGVYNSRKAGRMFAHESRGHGHAGGEKLAIMRCEVDPEVDDMRTQHIRFELVVDGQVRQHFPDILKLRHDGLIEIEEVKHDHRWRSDDQYRQVIELAGAICREIGWSYIVSTAADIAPDRRVRDNILQVQAKRFVDYGDADLIAVLSALRVGGGKPRCQASRTPSAAVPASRPS